MCQMLNDGFVWGHAQGLDGTEPAIICVYVDSIQWHVAGYDVDFL